MKPMTQQQANVLAFMRDFIAAKGYSPTGYEIAAHMGWKSHNAAYEVLGVLRRKGWIRKDRGIARSYRLVNADTQPIVLPARQTTIDRR